MGKRRVVFLDDDITVYAKDGNFYADTGIEGSALVATSPRLLLRHIETMRRAYEAWETKAGECSVMAFTGIG